GRRGDPAARVRGHVGQAFQPDALKSQARKPDLRQRRITMSTTATQARTKPSQPQTLEEHIAWVQKLKAEGADLQPLVNPLLQEKFETQAAWEQIRRHHEALREEIETLCSPEQYPVVITGVHTLDERPTVEVAGNGSRLRVAIHPSVPLEQLEVG